MPRQEVSESEQKVCAYRAAPFTGYWIIRCATIKNDIGSIVVIKKNFPFT
jgi:hypothetical protein